MRERPFPIISDLYSTGPRNGFATKVRPPILNEGNGKIPAQKFAAEWQNYNEDRVRKQLERSANVAYRNWTKINAVISTPADFLLTRYAHSPYFGATMAVNTNGANNTFYFMSDWPELDSGAWPTYVVTPASGNFQPRDILWHPHRKRWVIVGANSGGPSNNNIWYVSQSFGATEITGPISQVISRICLDSKTGDIFGFCSDTNRSVIRYNNATDTWSDTGGDVGAGTPDPHGTTLATLTFPAAHDGQVAIAYTQANEGARIRRAVSPWTTWNSADVPHSGSPTLFDFKYYDGDWLVLNSETLHILSGPDAASVFDVSLGWTSQGAAGTPSSGVITNVGAAWLGAGPLGGQTFHRLFIMPVHRPTAAQSEEIWAGAMFRDVTGNTIAQNANHQVRFDGSALWVNLDATTDHTWRSMRS